MRGRRVPEGLRGGELRALPETLDRVGLFGYERGAFTARAAKKREIRTASGGTIFLDENWGYEFL